MAHYADGKHNENMEVSLGKSPLMSKRKFYRTVIQIEVLSEEPFEYENLNDVYYAITEGDCSGKIETVEACILNAKQAAKVLQAQDSDPEFFQLTEDGEDLS